ncbi:MAG: inositol phosphorylceramide synthase [Aeromicrobium sp.]|nr:MAG: inositol phosphorylceramide synthase [Aeromicrobium sp.]
MVFMLSEWWRWLREWPYTFGVALSLFVGIFTIGMSQSLGIELKDPEGFLGPAYVRLPLIALAFFALGVLPMAIRRAGFKGIKRGVIEIVNEQWTWGRVLHIGTGLTTFYVCYVSYRNLKSFLPTLMGDIRYDRFLFELDYWLMLGNPPEQVLHTILGTGFSAQILSIVYVSYLMVVPLSLGAFLVLNRDVSLGAWYATALSLNWLLGVVSYYAVPSLGPAFYEPARFQLLPESGVTSLQNSLARNATNFYENPTGPAIYGIAGFASLHVSVVLTVCLFLRRTDQAKWLQNFAWTYMVLTGMATIYFGWHYLADVLGGALIGWLSVAIAGWATGNGFLHQKHHKLQLTAEDDEVVPA